MNLLNRVFAAIFIVLMTANCTRLEVFLSRNAEGSEFDKQLAEYYKEFAQSEAEKCDWSSSRRFINKGMALLNGEEIEPEKLKWWNIPKEYLPELVEARNKIDEILANDQLLEQKPSSAAKAMYSFDCWVEEQAESWQEEDIKACKDNFYQAVKDLEEEPLTPKVVIEETASAIDTNLPNKTAENEMKFNIIDEKRRIYFSYDSYDLMPEAVQKIQTLVTEIKKFDNQITEIFLNGYTDRAGPNWYNLQLSRKRALAVKQKMKELGVNEEKIKLFAYGIENPIVDSLNPKKQPKNRRVEVIISDN